MKKTYLQKGFTLIELLVVIAIIGILSSVVLTSLSTARAKAADTAIRADLKAVTTSASIEYTDLGNSYNTGTDIAGEDCSALTNQTDNIFRNTSIQNALIQIKTLNGSQALYCNVTEDAYAIVVPLRTAETFWCIDSAGGTKGAFDNGTAYNALTGATGALDDASDVICNSAPS